MAAPGPCTCHYKHYALVIYPSIAVDKRLMIGDCLPDSLNKIGTYLSFNEGLRDLRKDSQDGTLKNYNGI